MLHQTVLPQTRIKPGATVTTAVPPFLKMNPFHSLSSQAEVISVSVPCSQAPHKSLLWKSRAIPLCSWGRKQELFSLGLRYAARSVCAETQMHVLWDGLLRQPRQPGLIKDLRFPPCQAPENSTSDFYNALKSNDALHNV